MLRFLFEQKGPTGVRSWAHGGARALGDAMAPGLEGAIRKRQPGCTRGEHDDISMQLVRQDGYIRPRELDDRAVVPFLAP